jgi:hypothetical protein
MISKEDINPKGSRSPKEACPAPEKYSQKTMR